MNDLEDKVAEQDTPVSVNVEYIGTLELKEYDVTATSDTLAIDEHLATFDSIEQAERTARELAERLEELGLLKDYNTPA